MNRAHHIGTQEQLCLELQLHASILQEPAEDRVGFTTGLQITDC